MRRATLHLLLSLLLLAAACGGGDQDPRHLTGPGRDGGWYAVSGVTRPGEPMSFGTIIDRGTTTQGEVVIRSVKLIEASGIDVVGVTVNGPGRAFAMIGAKRGYPLPETEADTLALPGAVLPTSSQTPYTGLSVTFGVKRDEPGRGVARGYEVEYILDGKTYTERFDTGLAVCAVPGYSPDSASKPDCPAPKKKE